MIKKLAFVLLLVLIFCSTNSFLAQKEKEVAVSNDKGELSGTLMLPKKKKNIPVVLIIAGSGPTDRNGNQAMMQTDTYKLIAEVLAENNIASLRYDKQGIGKSQEAGRPQSEMVFEHFVDDAVLWIDYLSNQKRFSDVIVLGHSEGVLIGTLAAQRTATAKLIAVAGTGRKIDEVILEQLSAQSDSLRRQAVPVFDSLRAGQMVEDVPATLLSLFHPSIQPYMISWMTIDPAEEISKLTCPTLVIQGTTDLQVKIKDAELLAAANEKATLEIIEGMNHILKDAPEDYQGNMMTYTDPKLSLNEDFVNHLVRYVNK